MIKRLFAAAILFCCTITTQAQTFSWNGNRVLADLSTDTILLPVSGLSGSINNNFGLAKVCFTINHPYKADITTRLIAPDGQSVLLTQAQGGDADNFTNTCVGMDGIPFELGTPPYTGLFLPAGDISSVNNGQNPNGVWQLLVSDVSNSDTGFVLFASIQFTNNPPVGGGLGGDNLGPQGPFIRAGVVCPGGTAGCDLLPDVTASFYEIANNMVETPGMLRVSNGTPNIGYGPLEIFGIDSCFCDGVPAPCNVPCANGAELQHIIRQRIYQKRPGTDTLGFYDLDAGAMTFHPEHGHLHVDHWADFTLRSATSDPDPRNWPIIGTSVKQSYCLVNLGTCADRPGECADNNGNTVLTVPNQGLGFYTGCGLNQGIYPGHWDVYSTSLNEPILLDNVCNGTYYIVSITDPNNIFRESDETNNWVAVPVTLTRQNPAPAITANRSTVLCTGDSIELTANLLPNYLWSTGDTSRTIIVRTPGTYTVSSSCGISTSTSQPFVVTQLPANAAAAVNVAITSGSNPSCAGAPLTFTATPTYGGNTPVYQWKVNGNNVGTNSNVFASTALTDGQVVTCTLTSNISCLAATPATSNSIAMTIRPRADANLSIAQTRGTNPMCVGDTATFTATVLNGAEVSYRWKLNNTDVGTNSNEYTNAALVNGDRIRCDVTAKAACPIIGVIGTGTGSNATNTCFGAAYPTYYGNGRQQHLILASELLAGGVQAGNLSSIAFTIGSAIGDPAILKGFTIKLAAVAASELTTTFNTTPLTTVFGPVDYTPQTNAVNTHLFNNSFAWDGQSNILVDICFENQVIGRKSYQSQLSVTSFNSTAYYQADSLSGIGACGKLAGSNRGNLRPNMLFNANLVKTLQSDSIVISANSLQSPSLSIRLTRGDSVQCLGTVTSFKATPSNTGASPAYQWTRNGTLIPGATSDTLTLTNLANNDSIRCSMTAGLVCGQQRQVLSNAQRIQIALPVYTFTGNGNWNIASNWANNAIPPAKLPSCSEIIVNPVSNGECFLGQQQIIAPGARITVMAGKKIRVLGNMLIKQ